MTPRRSGLSIRLRVPLLMMALLAAVIAVYTAITYREVEQSAMTAARDRLKAAPREFATLLESSTAQFLSNTRGIADSRSITAYLRTPDAATGAAARATLQEADGPSAALLGFELRDAVGRPLLFSRDTIHPAIAAADIDLRALVVEPDEAAIGPIRRAGTTLLYPVAAAVTDGGRVLGYVVQWRQLGTSAATFERIEQMIGTGARLFLGNESGDLWTDLLRPAPPPPFDAGEVEGAAEYRRDDGGKWIGATAAVSNAPWVVLVEFPRDLVLVRAEGTLRRLIIFGFIMLLLGVVGAWALTGGMTGAIGELAEAATALSRGDYARRTRIDRADELGTLSETFNTMGASVAAAHAALEVKVRELAVLESQNRDSRERLQQVIASSPDVIYELAVTNGAAMVTWISQNVERVLGYGAPDVMAPGWWQDVVHPDERDVRATGWIASGPAGETGREYRIRHRDGTYRWVHDQQRLRRDEHGDVVQVVGAMSDITRRRSLEEQFRQAQKLEAVGRLAGGVAHDFNNIVTVILGECDLALEHLPAGEPLHGSLAEIRTAAERASHLTRQLLTFSRKQLTQTTLFDLNDVVRDIQNMIRRLIGEDVDLQIRLADSVEPVAADRGQIEQILLNLVINARDAMPQGGKLVIETADVDLDEEYVSAHANARTGEFVALVVSDTGTGMSAEVQRHLFEPFFTTKQPGRGTGLGLATSYSIARELGGHIGVYSEEGVGTTMKLYLPRAARDGAGDVREARERAAGGGETILLVEDEAQVRAVAARMLRLAGYTVIEAGDGEEALELLERSSQRIDLLFTDVVMPRMGGRQLAERVRDLRPGTRVLFTSGYTEDVIVQHELTDQGIILLHKPFTREGLTAKVRETLDMPPPAS